MPTKNVAAPVKSKKPPTFTDQFMEPFSRLRTEVDRVFDSFPSGLSIPFDRLAKELALPAVEMKETPKKFKFSMEVPGVDPEDLQVSVEGNALVIKGEKKEKKVTNKAGYHYSERRYGSFARRFDLPSAADAKHLKATSKDGVLHITLSKRPKGARDKNRVAIER